MTPAPQAPDPTEAVDFLFSHFSGGPTGPPPLPGLPSTPLGQAPDLASPEEPPALQKPGDLQAANDWLRRERHRLEAYTRTQLARLQREHQALVGQNYINEQTLILRSQEMSRKEDLLS